MSKCIFISLLFFNSLWAASQISNLWTGYAYWSYDNSPMRCPLMKVKFSEDEGHFNREMGFLDCDMLGMELPPFSLNKNSKGELFSPQGVNVGLITSDSLEMEEAYDENVKIKVSMKSKGNSADYLETWYKNSSPKEIIYVIKARLFKGGSFEKLEN